MNKQEPEKLDLNSMDITESKTQELLRLFPEIRTEGGKVDFDRLKLALGQTVDVGKERYGMNWPGKAECFKTIQKPSTGTLRPAPEESVNFDTTENLIIEGDNLEVLKLLQKSYAGKVKMIYIDPPYNTGNDFIYPDNYSESLQTYLEYTGQVDAGGKKFSTNTETDGRFHSKWLNMMYPRLYLARNLLREDGVIFVSIADQELSNIRSLLDLIFGEENYVNTVCVRAKPSAGASGGGEDKRLKKNVEFLLVYSKNREGYEALDLGQAFDETALEDHIESMRKDGKSWKYTRALTNSGNRVQVATTVDGDGNEIRIFRHTNFVIEPISKLAGANETEIKSYVRHFDSIFRDTNAQSSIRTRVIESLGKEDGLFSIDYVPRSGRNKGRLTTVLYRGPNKDQIAWLKDIARVGADGILIRGKTGTFWGDFNWNNVSKEGDVVFPNGKKPIAFIERMIQLSSKPNEAHVVLDFFAGSGSTAHAVIASNQKDDGNRKYVLVQLPENAEGTNSKTISSLCIQRVRNVNNELSDAGIKSSDAGFRVFKLDASNFKQWSSETTENSDSINKQLELHVDHIVPGRTQQDILFEILLKSGFQPTVAISTLTLAGQKVFSVVNDAFLICLERNITLETIRAMAEKKPERVVCLDHSFENNDQLKANAVQIFKSQGIVFRTV